MSTSSPVIYNSKILQKNFLTNDVLVLRLEKPIDFTYLAGQFIQIHIPDNNKKILRSYSLSSTPKDSFLELCIKILNGGKMGQYLNTINVKDGMYWQGPLGRFAHTEKDTASVCCVATGVGIAPIMGIITDELEHKKKAENIQLIFGLRHEEDFFWIDRLNALQTAYPQFHYRIILSQPGTDWQGPRGYVTDFLPTKTDNQRFFICGNPTMVRDVRTILTERGASNAAIHFEIF